MIPPALSRFNTTIGGLTMSTGTRNQVLSAGRVAVTQASREAIQHYRKHMVERANDVDETPERRQLAQFVVAELDAMTSQNDAWWLDL